MVYPLNNYYTNNFLTRASDIKFDTDMLKKKYNKNYAYEIYYSVIHRDR